MVSKDFQAWNLIRMTSLTLDLVILAICVRVHIDLFKTCRSASIVRFNRKRFSSGWRQVLVHRSLSLLIHLVHDAECGKRWIRCECMV